MLAFHNDNTVKQKYLIRVLDHQKHDRIVQGIGWENGKGCAVGCTLENYNHGQYEVELGIPEWLARLEDRIFEGLEKSEALKWPARFLEAINVGADLDKVKIPFLIFGIESARAKFDHKKYPEQLAAIDGVLFEFKKETLDLRALAASRDAADAADAAAAAARRNEFAKFADKLLELLRECK